MAAAKSDTTKKSIAGKGGKRDGAGRPQGSYTAINDEQFRIILDDYLINGSIEKACKNAGCYTSAFYYRYTTDRNFSDSFDAVKRARMLAIGARSLETVEEAVKKDARLALDYLKLTEKDFKERTETTAEISGYLSIEDKANAAAEWIQNQLKMHNIKK